jgi:hypothetical protein
VKLGLSAENDTLCYGKRLMLLAKNIAALGFMVQIRIVKTEQ